MDYEHMLMTAKPEEIILAQRWLANLDLETKEHYEKNVGVYNAFRLRNITPDELFLNLNHYEKLYSLLWFNGLRDEEKERVMATIDAFNRTDFSEFGVVGMEHAALIVAGSSLYFWKKPYDNIDFFIASESPIHAGKSGAHPVTEMFDFMRELPRDAYLLRYSKEEEAINTKHMEPSEMVEQGLGALITVALLYDLPHFRERRPGKNDDILFEEGMGAEQFIETNQQEGSKFAVLSRQYKP